MKDYYDVLGCDEDSTQEEIKRAYRALALKHHPDKNTSGRKEEFEKVLEAWKVLGDPKAKEEYDVARKQAELDSESLLVYERLSADDLKSIDQDTFIYPCRCGGDYQIKREFIAEGNCTVHVPCQECTFIIVIET